MAGSERHTAHEARLAEVLYDATAGNSGVPWEAAYQGMWLADAARILGAYQHEAFALVRGVSDGRE
jgi:hypothetical protein